jgi:hypothetical protein
MAITLKYNGTDITPKPNLSVSQTFVKTGDGRKIGVTYAINLSGTIVSSGATTELKFDSLLTGAKNLRLLFKEEGKKLEIKSAGQELSFYPRVVSIDFPDNQYISTLPYTISLEADCAYSDDSCGATGVQADIKKQLGLGPDFFSAIHVSSATDDWSIAPTGTPKGRVTVDGTSTDVNTSEVYSPMYTVTHTINAAGKRSYGADGLIRKAWENAELWCVSRLGIPDSLSVEHTASQESTIDVLFEGSSVTVNHNNNSTSGYGVFNYTKTQQVSQTEGTYSITESYTLAKSGGDGTGSTAKGNVTSQINVDTAYDQNSQPRTDGARFFTVTVNGTITGLESRSIAQTTVNSSGSVTINSFTAPTQTKSQAALADFANYHDDNIFHLADKLNHNGAGRPGFVGLVTTPISRTSSINDATGTISFTVVFNNRQSLVNGTIAENGNWTYNKGAQKYAIIEVPNKSNGPVVQNMGTKGLNSETMSVELTMGYTNRGSKPVVTESTMRSLSKPPSTSVFNASSGKTTMTVSDNQTWNPQTGKFTRSITRQWMDGC